MRRTRFVSALHAFNMHLANLAKVGQGRKKNLIANIAEVVLWTASNYVLCYHIIILWLASTRLNQEEKY